jgi:hypothetical protein
MHLKLFKHHIATSIPCTLHQDMQHLKSLYKSMATSFSEGGFNLASIASVHSLFEGSEPNSLVQPRPKLYSEAVPGIAPGSTRILAIPLEQSPEATAITDMVAKRMRALLPLALRVGARYSLYAAAIDDDAAAWRLLAH